MAALKLEARKLIGQSSKLKRKEFTAECAKSAEKRLKLATDPHGLTQKEKVGRWEEIELKAERSKVKG